MKTRKNKHGGGSHIDFFEEPISTEPNTSPGYHSVGIIFITTIKATNMLRRYGTHLFNAVGKNGFETSIYAELRREAIHELKSEMKKKDIDRISSFRFEFTENSTNIVANCYGTALKKQN